MFQQINPYNWNKLLHVDTPPCLSLYLPGGKNSKVNKKAFRRLKKRTRLLLNRHYSGRQSEKLLKTLETMGEQDHIFRSCLQGQSLGFFISPELSTFAVLDSKVSQKAVVADSFHILPLLEDHWHLRPLGVFVENGSAEIYAWQDHQFQMVDRMPADSAARLHLKMSYHPVVLVAGDHSCQALYQGLQEKRNSLSLHTVELGRMNIENFYTIFPTAAYAQLQNQLFSLERMYENETAFPQVDDSLRESLKKLENGQAKALILPKGKTLWGKIQWKLGRLVMHKRQMDAFDDCILDDLSETALRNGVKLCLVDANRWKAPQDFLLAK